MATRTLEILVDDLDGSPANQTVPFALDGVSYEVDLSQENADELRSCFERYIEVARRTGGRRKPPQIHATDEGVVVETAAGNGGGKRGSRDLRVVRTWAEEQGYEISERGRIPTEIMQAYEEARRAAS